MAITVEGLRLAYPVITEEFYDSTRVMYWLDEAQLDLRVSIWGARYERGVYAYATHNLIVEKAMDDANADGLGGIDANRGPVVGESDTVDGVSHSVSYAGSYAGPTTANASSSGDDWKTTRPGTDYFRMARIVSLVRGAAYVQ